MIKIFPTSLESGRESIPAPFLFRTIPVKPEGKPEEPAAPDRPPRARTAARGAEPSGPLAPAPRRHSPPCGPGPAAHGGGVTYSTARRKTRRWPGAAEERGARSAPGRGKSLCSAAARGAGGAGWGRCTPLPAAARFASPRLARVLLPPALPPARLEPPPANAGRSEEPALTICCEAPPPIAAASLAGGSRPGTPPRRRRARGELYAALRCSLHPRSLRGPRLLHVSLPPRFSRPALPSPRPLSALPAVRSPQGGPSCVPSL